MRQQRLAAQEATGLVPGEGEAEAGLDRRVFFPDVVAPVPVELLHAQRVQRVVAGVPEAEIRALRDDRVVGVLDHLRRHVELPAQLAHIGDAGRADSGEAEIDLARGDEGEGLVR
jgi:hypothetical protein